MFLRFLKVLKLRFIIWLYYGVCRTRTSWWMLWNMPLTCLVNWGPPCFLQRATMSSVSLTVLKCGVAIALLVEQSFMNPRVSGLNLGSFWLRWVSSDKTRSHVVLPTWLLLSVWLLSKNNFPMGKYVIMFKPIYGYLLALCAILPYFSCYRVHLKAVVFFYTLQLNKFGSYSKCVE